MDLIVKTANNAREFIDLIRLSHMSWNTANFGDIGFRGQSNSEWQLVPSAFRPTKLGYGKSVVVDTDKNISNLCHGEFMCVKQFLMESDAIGLHVPGDSRFFRDPERLEMPLRKSDYKVWPPNEVLETLAIAQHHGVPTRLIDFSYHPMIAAFFAADGAQKKVVAQKEGMDRNEKFAVWATNLHFIRQLWNDQFGVERIREITVSRATNSFLHAQHGLFLLDTGVNHSWKRKDFGLEPLNQVIIGRAKRCVDEDEDRWKSYFEKFPPLIKFELSIAHANEVLQILKTEGITRAYIYPSYESVVEILKEMQ